MNMENLNKIWNDLCEKYHFHIWVVMFVVALAMVTFWTTDTSAEEDVCKPIITEQPVIIEQALPDPRDKLTQYIANNYRVTPSEAKHIVETVYSYSAEEDFPPAHLVFAVIAVESSFRPTVVSHKGARGLMQVMPINEPGITIEDNIVAGIWVLQQYRARVSTDEAALQAYNVGITAYKRGKRSQKYLSKVEKEKKRFEVLTFNTF